MTFRNIAVLLNEWIDNNHDLSAESLDVFCRKYARTYDEYQGMWYSVCGLITED